MVILVKLLQEITSKDHTSLYLINERANELADRYTRAHFHTRQVIRYTRSFIDSHLYQLGRDLERWANEYYTPSIGCKFYARVWWDSSYDRIRVKILEHKLYETYSPSE
jgi:hypothetical protein